MPNSNLPPKDYLGDVSRKTGGFQSGVNDVQNWVINLQDELSALSGTTVQEGAVRGVGTGSSDLVERGSLGNAAFGDTPTSDWYEETIVTLDGDFDSGQDLKIVRVGNVVTVTAQSVLTYPSSSFVASSSGLIPSQFRPVSDVTLVNEMRSTGLVGVKILPDGRYSINSDTWDGSSVALSNSKSAPTISYTI